MFLKRSFPFYCFSVSSHWSLRKAFSSVLAILWNSACRWVYLSFSPLPFASLLFSAICKASSDNHFAFLFLGDGFDHRLLYNGVSLVSAGKEFTFYAGDLGLIPGLGRSLWRRERLPTPVFWPGKFYGLYHGVTKSWTQLSDFHFHFTFHSCRIIRTSIRSSRSLSALIPWIYLSLPLYNLNGFYLGHTWKWYNCQ